MIIALEGIDNCGKTTVSSRLEQYFKDRGYSVFVSKELTTDVGDLIKNKIKSECISPIIKTYLFAADRQLRLESIDSNEQYDILIFDRYLHSAIVYREAEGLDPEWVRRVNQYVPPFDIGIYIDITSDESIRRNANTKFNIIYAQDFLTAARNSYLHKVKKGDLTMIDGMCDIDSVFNQVVDILLERGV